MRGIGARGLGSSQVSDWLNNPTVSVPSKSVTTYANVVLADSPAVYVSFNTTAPTDLSGNLRNPNTESGTFTKSEPALIGSGNSWKSSGSQYLQWTAASWNNTSSATWEVWAKPTTSFPTYDALWDGDSSGRRFQMCITGGKVRFIWWTTSGGPYTATGGTTLTLNTRYHLVCTYDAATGAGTVYVNGVSDGTSTSPALSLMTSGPWLALGAGGGGSAIGNGGYWTGWLDEAAFYPTALSSARVMAHYNAGL